MCFSVLIVFHFVSCQRPESARRFGRRIAAGRASSQDRRPAPDFSLKGVDGKMYSLADFKDARLLMVIFLSNHCPYSHAAETRLCRWSRK